VCPVKIEIPRILLELREETPKNRTEQTVFRMFAWIMRHPRIYEKGSWLRLLGKLPEIGPLKAWATERELPQLPPRTFRELWRQRKT
jgi:L-lactate dehydrogenase complex protein LldF